MMNITSDFLCSRRLALHSSIKNFTAEKHFTNHVLWSMISLNQANAMQRERTDAGYEGPPRMLRMSH